MQKLLNIDFKWVIIIVLVLFFGVRELSRSKEDSKTSEIVKIDGEKYEVIKRIVDTVYINREIIKEIKGETIYKDTTIYVEVSKYIEIEIDTTEILKAYFAKNVYKDTLILEDSISTIAIVDTISRNKILHRTWTSNISEPIIKTDVYLKDSDKISFYYGLYGGLDKKNVVSSIGGGFILKTKKDKLYQLNLGIINNGLNNNIQPYIGVGAYWKIKFK